MTFSVQGDGSILTGGTIPFTGVYEVTYASDLSGVTGVLLEVLPHVSLPDGGPGHFPDNGNFVLTELELEVDPVPEPGVLLVFGAGLAGASWARRRSRGVRREVA